MLSNLWVPGLIFITIIYHPVLTNEVTLKFLIVIARDGDRRPDSSYEGYPNDPYKNKNFDGKLTESGRKRELDFGKFLNEIYGPFLGKYVPGSVEARSTDEDRSKESLKMILKGLFPDAVVPTKFDDKKKDTLLFPQLCPGYAADYLLTKQNAAIKVELKKLEVFMQNLYKWTGKKIDSALDMYHLYSTLEAEEYMNLTLAEWTKGVYPEGDLLKGTVLEFMIQNYGKSMIKRNGGRLIKQMIEDMDSVRKGTMDPNRKLMLYAVHTPNIIAVLKALELFYPHVPKFSSALIAELHKIKEVYYIKLLYYLGVPPQIKELRVPGCDDYCALDKFSKKMTDVIPAGSQLVCDKVRSALGG